MTPLDWLLEDNAPGVAYLARARLAGASELARPFVVTAAAQAQYDQEITDTPRRR